MARTPRPFTVTIVWGAVTAALFACTTDDSYDGETEDLTEEVLSCEEAVSKLADCCPGAADLNVKCHDYRYRGTGPDCQGGTHYVEGHTLPGLNLEESQCIRRRSCKDLVDSGVCERAKQVVSRGTHLAGESEDTAVATTDAGQHPNICQ